MSLTSSQLRLPEEDQYEDERAEQPIECTKGDIRAILTAIKDRQRWEIPKKIEKKLPAAMARIALGEENPINGYTPRVGEQIGAARVLAQMEAQNQADQHLAAKLLMHSAESGDCTIEVVYEDRPRPEQKFLSDDDDEDEQTETASQPSASS